MGRIIQGEIGIPFPCQPLVTGQTTQYSSKEDDGYWEKGVTKKYVALTLAQYSGSVNITLNAKTVAVSNNCVADKKTGLMWLRYVPAATIGPGNDGKLLWVDDVNDEDIFDFCDQANVQSLAGYSDWRVPNIKELFELLEFEGAGPYFNAVFVGNPSNYFWSSTTLGNDATKAFVWASWNALGVYITGAVKATSSYYCFLIRGPK